MEIFFVKREGLPLCKRRRLQFYMSKCGHLDRRTGLPKDAAPFISFVSESNDLFKGIAKLEDQYNLEIEPNKYIVIGADGSGNPIAINIKKNDTVEWLDHEDYFEPNYFNNSVESLLSFLIIYRDFLNGTITSDTESSSLNDDFTDDQYNVMKARMLEIDSSALTEVGFWKEELDILLKNREYLSF